MVGSLMSGWKSDADAQKRKSFTRKGSFTKAEIDNFWRERRRVQEEKRRGEELDKMYEDAEHEPVPTLKDNRGESSGTNSPEIVSVTGGSRIDSELNSSLFSGLPDDVLESDDKPFGPDDPEDMTDEEKAARVKDWWTKSHHAFLNAPPEKGLHEAPKGYSYQSQHHLHANVDNDTGLSRVTALPSAVHF
eukprot:TRINITY_DN6_c0_g1_i1.p1 TRINITY_DN6_c0_g1~~TRINITY_DN6_c0_g1_i1.p1  ORF type:complete len:190 (+),score=40.12 TRINITY_DN6_c0_g1_i1:241-810(+)